MNRISWILCLMATSLASGGALAAPYAQLSSTETQLATVAPKLVTMNSNDAVKDLAHEKGVVTVKTAGTYFVMAAAQIGTTKEGAGTVRLWMRINGKDVDNSNTEQTVEPGFTAVLVCQGVSEFKAGDKIEMYCSASKDGEGLALVASTPKGEPVIPSIIFSAFQVENIYAQVSSTATQPATATPSLVALNSVDAAKAIDHDKGTLTVKEDGVYFVMAAGQSGSVKGAGKGTLKLWMRVNGKDVDNSNTEQTLDGGVTAVLVCQGIAELKKGDKVTLAQSSTGSGGGLIASTPRGEPVVPSMILSMFKVKSPYAQLSSTETQPAAAKAGTVTLNSVDAAKGAENAKGVVTVKEAGTYFVIAAGQVGSVKDGRGSVKLWMGLNGKPVDNSNTEQTVKGGYTAVLVCQGIAELKAGDRLELLQSARGTGVGMLASTPRGEPVIPSMIFSLFKVD